MAPEIVFPGLTDGISFGPPTARPTKNAAASVTQVTSIGNITSAVPAAAPMAKR